MFIQVIIAHLLLNGKPMGQNSKKLNIFNFSKSSFLPQLE